MTRFYGPNDDIYIGVSRDEWDSLWNSLDIPLRLPDKQNPLAGIGYLTLRVDDVVYFTWVHTDEDLESVMYSKAEGPIFTALCVGELSALKIRTEKNIPAHRAERIAKAEARVSSAVAALAAE